MAHVSLLERAAHLCHFALLLRYAFTLLFYDTGLDFVAYSAMRATRPAGPGTTTVKNRSAAALTAEPGSSRPAWDSTQTVAQIPVRKGKTGKSDPLLGFLLAIAVRERLDASCVRRGPRGEGLCLRA